MYTTTLRKVGGSVMMTVPPVLLQSLQLEAGATVALEIEGDRLTIKADRPRYTVEELLADYDSSSPLTDEEREWLDAPPVGREIIRSEATFTSFHLSRLLATSSRACVPF